MPQRLPARPPLAEHGADGLRAVADAFDLVRALAPTKKLVDSDRAAVIRVVVVEDDQSTLDHTVKKILQHAKHAGVPVRIDAQKGDGADLIFCGRQRLLEPTLHNSGVLVES